MVAAPWASGTPRLVPQVAAPFAWPSASTLIAGATLAALPAPLAAWPPLRLGGTDAEPYADTLAKVAAGRTALVARLRTIAARVEELPLESVAEVLGVLEAAVAVCEQRAAVGLERAPTYNS